MIIGIDWGSYLDYKAEVMLPWADLVQRCGVQFAVFKGNQEQISQNGNYSTVKNMQSARAAGVPIVGCYYWHDPTASPSYLVEIYSRAIEREQPDFIVIDIEQWDDGVGGKVPPAQISETARIVCQGIRDRHPDKRVIVYSRRNFPQGFAPGMDAWLPEFDGGWVASWPDYGMRVYHAPSWEYIRGGQTRHLLATGASEDIFVEDWQPSNMATWTTWTIWQYSSRMMLPADASYGGQLDWNVFNGTLSEMLDWVGLEETMTTLHVETTPQSERATVFTWRSDQALKVPVAELGADAIILPMGGYDVWNGAHMPIYQELTFKGRFGLVSAAGKPVIGRYKLHGGRWGIEQFGKDTLLAQSCGPEMDEAQKQESCRNNLVLPALLGAWCDGAFSMDGLFARSLKWLDIQALELSMVETVGFKGATEPDFWQALSWNHIAQPLKWLMLRGYIPNIPIIMFTGPWFLEMYPNDLSIVLANAKGWLWLHLGQWTLKSTATFATLAELWPFRPVEKFNFSSVPDGYGDRVLMHEYSDQTQRCRQVVDVVAMPETVSLSLWQDRAAAMNEMLKYTGPVVVPPPVVVPGDLEARVVALEGKMTAILAGFAGMPK
jgi:GH25 family lysozyme M1 (1,4-beta-N-acetylmuramidase)